MGQPSPQVALFYDTPRSTGRAILRIGTLYGLSHAMSQVNLRVTFQWVTLDLSVILYINFLWGLHNIECSFDGHQLIAFHNNKCKVQ